MAKVSRDRKEPGKIVNQTIVNQVAIPYWRGTVFTPTDYLSVLYGTGSSWSQYFDTPSATDWMQFTVGTSSGELDVAMAGVDLAVARFEIEWEQDSAYDIEYYLCEGAVAGAGDVQMIFNGTFLGTKAILRERGTLNGKRGPNSLTLIRDLAPASIGFYAKMFDGKAGRWTQP